MAEGSFANAPYVLPVTIRFGDCDPAGMIYYPRVFDMFETALEDWLLVAVGESYRHWIVNERRGLPRVRVGCEFIKPLEMGERLDLAVLVGNIGRSSFGLELPGRVGDEVRFRGSVVLVHMSLDTRKAEALPGPMRERLEAYSARWPAGST